MGKQLGPLEEPAGEWFVNRKEELDIFWKWATGIPHPGRRSFALIGLRRTGKTAILHKTFNRLFNEQQRVLPVYISFVQYLNRTEPITAYEFAEEYFAGYVRSYLAFRYHRPDFHQDKLESAELHKFAREVSDELMLRAFDSYDTILAREHVRAHNIMQWVINFPKGYAWTKEIPTAIFVDEFQILTNVLNPDDGRVRNLTDSFQHASETRYAPMLVSGSSLSMMVDDALGGLLSGRFQTWQLKPLSQEFAIDLALRLGRQIGVAVTEEVAEALYELTKGYPYSIESILNSVSPDVKRLPDVNALHDIVFFEVTNGLGALHEHYENEYGKYVRRLNGKLNGDGTTRKILFWLTNFPGEHLHPRRIAEKLGLEVMPVQESLEKLYKLDILARASTSTFWGPTDPLLLKFLRYEHYLDVDDLLPKDAEAKVRKELNNLQGEMNRQAGHFSEIIVAGVLRNYDDRVIDTEPYFTLPGSVTLPRMETILRREGVVKMGIPHEIDVVGEYKLHNQQEGNAALGVWLVSVRHQLKKMGEGEIEAFIRDAAAFQAEKGYGAVTRWYFSKAGSTSAAQERLRAEGMYCSDLEQFNRLSGLFGLLPLRIGV